MQWNIAVIILVVLHFSNGAVINVEIEKVRNIDGNSSDVIKPPVDNIMEEVEVSTSTSLLQNTNTNLNVMPSTIPPRFKDKQDNIKLNPTRAAAFREKEDNVIVDTKPNALCLKCLESHAYRAKPTETPRFYGKPIQSPPYHPQYAQPAAPPYAQYPGYTGGYPINPYFAGIPTGLNPNVATVVTPNGNFTIISGFNTGFPTAFLPGIPTAGFPTVFG